MTTSTVNFLNGHFNFNSAKAARRWVRQQGLTVKDAERSETLSTSGSTIVHYDFELDGPGAYDNAPEPELTELQEAFIDDPAALTKAQLIEAAADWGVELKDWMTKIQMIEKINQ